MWNESNFSCTIGHDNTRLMGITDCAGVLSTSNNDSKPNGSTCRDGFFRGAGEHGFSGNTNINSKGSSELTGTSAGWLCLPVVSGPWKRWWFPSSGKLESPQHFIQKEHFKVKGFYMVRDLVKQGDWLAKIDLKDAYFLIPVHLGHQNFLQFTWKVSLYQFPCLPFRLSCTPRVFKVMKPVVAFLRERRMRWIIYLHDLLVISNNLQSLTAKINLIEELFHTLSLVINENKSHMVPPRK